MTTLLLPALASAIGSYAKAKLQTYKPQEHVPAVVQSRPEAPLIISHPMTAGADTWSRRADAMQAVTKYKSRRELPKSWLRVLPETYHDKVDYKLLERAHLLRQLEYETYDDADELYVMATNPRATLPPRLARPNVRPFRPGT